MHIETGVLLSALEWQETHKMSLAGSKEDFAAKLVHGNKQYS